MIDIKEIILRLLLIAFGCGIVTYVIIIALSALDDFNSSVEEDNEEYNNYDDFI